MPIPRQRVCGLGLKVYFKIPKRVKSILIEAWDQEVEGSYKLSVYETGYVLVGEVHDAYRERVATYLSFYGWVKEAIRLNPQPGRGRRFVYFRVVYE